MVEYEKNCSVLYKRIECSPTLTYDSLGACFSDQCCSRELFTDLSFSSNSMFRSKKANPTVTSPRQLYMSVDVAWRISGFLDFGRLFTKTMEPTHDSNKAYIACTSQTKRRKWTIGYPFLQLASVSIDIETSTPWINSLLSPSNDPGEKLQGL